MTIPLRAGVARADITPPIGIGHAGWGAQTHQRAAGIDLPLWVTALAIGDADTTVVIVDIDCMYLFEQEADAVRKAIVRLTSLPEANVRISFTHTHSGPVSGSTWSAWMSEGAELVAAYDHSIGDAAAGAAWAAIRAMEPVRIGSGSGSSSISVNRRYQRPEDDVVVVGRNPAGLVDREVQVIRVDTLDGQPLATIVDFACHPITVGPDNDLITPDYPGAMKRVVEQATGSTCLFLQGAAHIAELDQLRTTGTGEEIRQQTMLAKRAGMRAGLARKLAGCETWPVEIHGISLGEDIALVAMAAEPFATIGMAIKAQSPFARTLVSGYTGVGWAYLPTADAYPLGGYEIEVTPFAPEAANLAAAACVDVLGALAAGREQ
jgi:hypothetical protein